MIWPVPGKSDRPFLLLQIFTYVCVFKRAVLSELETALSDIPTTTARRVRPHIQLKNDILVPRRDFADELGVTDRTCRRLNLPTTYVGNVAHVLRNASLDVIAQTVRRRNQPRGRIRAA
jgi:hypothetical protein